MQQNFKFSLNHTKLHFNGAYKKQVAVHKLHLIKILHSVDKTPRSKDILYPMYYT